MPLNWEGREKPGPGKVDVRVSRGVNPVPPDGRGGVGGPTRDKSGAAATSFGKRRPPQRPQSATASKIRAKARLRRTPPALHTNKENLCIRTTAYLYSA